MIKVSGLTKKYGPTTAVDDITFEVEKGEIIGFLGPNGAGKTTTMRMLTCFLPPTEGTAEVAGFDVMEQPIEVKRRIGYLPEQPPVYLEMSVVEYLSFVARLKGISGPDVAGRVAAVTESCSLGDVRRKLIGRLSKGYRQRVGLAQALIHNPDVLILDEPTAGLDPKQIIEVRELIRDLAGEHTIILSTHILPEVSSTCGRVIIINEGRIEASDTPEQLTARLQGHEAVRLEIDGPPDEIEQRLNSVGGVGSVARGDARAGRTSWNVELSGDSSVRGELARAVVEAGWGLHEMRTVGLSLEDVFLKLTGADDESQADGDSSDAPDAGSAAAGTAEETAAEETEAQ